MIVMKNQCVGYIFHTLIDGYLALIVHLPPATSWLLEFFLKLNPLLAHELAGMPYIKRKAVYSLS